MREIKQINVQKWAQPTGSGSSKIFGECHINRSSMGLKREFEASISRDCYFEEYMPT